MELKYNVTGAKRKELVKVVSDTTGARAEYKFMPTCSFEIDFFTVTKDGTLVFDDRAESEVVEKVLTALSDAGFECEAGENAALEGGTAEESTDAAPDTAEGGITAQDANVGLTVRIPLEQVAVGNLTRLLEVKGSLIKNALGLTALPISIEEDAVSFPWFEELPDADEVKAYTHLIAALCEMSRNQKSICSTSTPPLPKARSSSGFSNSTALRTVSRTASTQVS